MITDSLPSSPGGLLASQRHLFDIPREVAYFNCAYMSPLLRHAVEVGRGAIQRKAYPWMLTPPQFFSELEVGRELFGRLVGATANDVAVIPAASYGMAVAARNLPVRRGQRVLMLDGGFPSVIYAWQARCRAEGAEAVILPRPEDHDWTRVVLEAIDQRTAVAALPVIHWTDGAMLDLARIGARLREVGAALALDVTQSLGVMPFSVADARPDFVVAPAYKWLLGPYSTGFMYVDPKWHQGEPIEHNWIARKGSEDFGGLVRYRDEFQPGARRFDVGEPSNFALLPVAIEGLRQLLEWGVDRIYPSVSRLASSIAEQVAPLGLLPVPAPFRAGHYLGFRRAGGLPEGLGARLGAQGIWLSVRGDALRVTPHLYNDSHDIDRLVTALRDALGPPGDLPRARGLG